MRLFWMVFLLVFNATTLWMWVQTERDRAALGVAAQMWYERSVKWEQQFKHATAADTRGSCP